MGPCVARESGGLSARPHGFPFFDRRSRISSGKQRGSRLQDGQRSVSLPVSGGGGVSRAATCNAWAMAARVLARNCCVKWTWTRRREPI